MRGARMGDESKAVGCVPPTALLFERAPTRRRNFAAITIQCVNSHEERDEL